MPKLFRKGHLLVVLYVRLKRFATLAVVGWHDSKEDVVKGL